MSAEVTSNELRVEVIDRVAHAVLDRPERLSALSTGLIADLIESFDRCERDDEVWAVLLTGAGDRSFCAGIDLKEMREADVGQQLPALPMQGTQRNLFEVIIECAKPVVAALNGVAAGGGCEIALARGVAPPPAFPAASSTRRAPGHLVISWLENPGDGSDLPGMEAQFSAEAEGTSGSSVCKCRLEVIQLGRHPVHGRGQIGCAGDDHELAPGMGHQRSARRDAEVGGVVEVADEQPPHSGYLGHLAHVAYADYGLDESEYGSAAQPFAEPCARQDPRPSRPPPSAALAGPRA